MHNRTLFLVIFLAIVFSVVGAPALAKEADNAPPGFLSLLQGTKYQTFLAEHRNTTRTLGEKGILPNLGNYFDPGSEGWGLDIQAVGGVIFVVWFTYNLDGTPTWYIIVGTPTAGDKGMSVAGNIESFKWDPFGTPGDQATATIVGTMTIAWSDESNAEVSWTLDGEAGSASIQHIRFAPPPTLANMTGHYFDANRPGWGFTLLTQGEFTVMTVYWYKDGQPVWAQGVITRPALSGFADLLYFTGPGLCPSCLDKGEVKGLPATEPLANLAFGWILDDPPLVGVTPTIFGPEDGPLGTEPFSEIFFPTVTEAITSVAGDNFDPEYTEFINAILGIGAIGGEKGPLCLAFEYDEGLFGGNQVGTLLPAYFKLDPEEGSFPMYLDASCTQPYEFVEFGGSDTAPSRLRMAWTDEDGVAYKWFAWFPNETKGDGDGKEEAFQGGFSVQAPGQDKGDVFNIRWYGYSRFLLIRSGGQQAWVPVDGRLLESLAQAEQDPTLLLFTRFVYP